MFSFKNEKAGLLIFSMILLVSVLLFTTPVSVNAAAAWAPYTAYKVGDIVTYSGTNYECLQAHTSLPGWEPSVVPALWKIATGGPTPTPTRAATATPTRIATATPTRTVTVTPTPTRIATVTPTPTRIATVTPTPTGIGDYPTWNSTAVYISGNRVVYNGIIYEAKWWTQGEAPPGTSGVWKTIGPANPTSTPSPTPTSIGTPTPIGPTPPPPPRMYVGYSSTWNTSIYDLTPANIPNYFTHINLAFAKPDTNYARGSYAFDQAIAGFEFVEGATTNNGQKRFTAQQAQDLRANIAALKARGTQVWVSVGGWSYSQGSAWTNFNAPRVVDLALDLGASGVDIDWESSGSIANKLTADQFACTKDGEIKGIISSLYNEIRSRGVNLGISIAGWSTGAYYVKGTPFEEGLVQWGSPYGGTMYRVVKDNGYMINHINLMSYDAGAYYDPREGYESYRAIYNGPINMGMEIAPEGAGGSVLKLNAAPGTVYDAEMLTGVNNDASRYYNVETMVNYIKYKGRPFDGFMIWQIWKERVYAPAPSGAASVNSAGQYVCRNLPLAGDPNQAVPNLPKLTP